MLRLVTLCASRRLIVLIAITIVTRREIWENNRHVYDWSIFLYRFAPILHGHLVLFTCSEAETWMHSKCLLSFALRGLSVLSEFWDMIWGLLCQKQVTGKGTINYPPQILWNVITCLCPLYLLLTHQSSYLQLDMKYFAMDKQLQLLSLYRELRRFSVNRCENRGRHSMQRISHIWMLWIGET